MEVLLRLPVRARGCRLERCGVRDDEIAGAVLHHAERDLVEPLQRVGIFEIADRTGHQADQRGDAVIAPSAHANRPLDSRALANTRLPLRADFGEIVRPVERGAGSVDAMNDGDRRVRQLQVGIDCANSWIVPGSELAEIDAREHLACEVNLARLDAVDVDDRNDTTDHDRELDHAELLQLLWIKRHVGRAEVDCGFLDQANSDARPYGLIADIVAGLCLVGVDPFRHHGRNEG